MKTKNIYNKGQSIQFLFTMVLLFSLAISAIFTVLFGAGIYKNIEKRMNENFSSTTALSYISNKVKQNDKAGMVSVENIEGIQVLKVAEIYDGAVYNTLIYCKDGELKELFCREDSGLALTDGMNIMDLQEISFKMVGDKLLKVKTSKDNKDYLLLSLRSEEIQHE